MPASPRGLWLPLHVARLRNCSSIQSKRVARSQSQITFSRHLLLLKLQLSGLRLKSAVECFGARFSWTGSAVLQLGKLLRHQVNFHSDNAEESILSFLAKLLAGDYLVMGVCGSWTMLSRHLFSKCTNRHSQTTLLRVTKIRPSRLRI